ncbi:putative O-methyltransferase YrrM [Halanaeroarchaeum sp. HSR-CO]|uniref:O-methyltransferase n=1 Tax=Halanaeroarchaeum sp. HSR-CO TaxID=2866382 RepID=UPI00217DDB7F|nr:O-methyltransferase [Halanaeroarchaeum sp. HSR-CO]UWG47628.1 putative O-methyltransferase YrrM [Halanaeroarchaeum sp. HSR-CO]
MTDILADPVGALLELGNGDLDPVVESMEAYAREQNFPIVGADVGRFLRVAATMVDAERVFEFGSGFGYSAVWTASALPDDGEIILTDYDEENLDRARKFVERAGYGKQASFEAGDAMTAFAKTTGHFDVVLIDHEKIRYEDAFERVADRVTDGGIVVADNMMDGPVDPEHVYGALAGEDPKDDRTAGIVAYIERIREDPDFESVLVPLGQGIAVSVRRPSR